MEFQTPGLQRGVIPFRCEAQLERERGWKGGSRREGDSAPSPGQLSVGKMRALDWELSFNSAYIYSLAFTRPCWWHTSESLPTGSLHLGCKQERLRGRIGIRGTSIAHRELRKKGFFLSPGLPGMGDFWVRLVGVSKNLMGSEGGRECIPLSRRNAIWPFSEPPSLALW